MKYNFHPAALTEYSEAVQFYAENEIEIAQNFINAVVLKMLFSELLNHLNATQSQMKIFVAV
jgi:hypothetical protein